VALMLFDPECSHAAVFHAARPTRRCAARLVRPEGEKGTLGVVIVICQVLLQPVTTAPTLFDLQSGCPAAFLRAPP